MTDDIDRIRELWGLVERRRVAPRVDRDAWIAAARQLFAPGERQACHVCGRFKGISQAHHVVPLTVQYDRGFTYPDQEHVWLCPNHHAIVHLFIPADDRSMALPATRARGQTTAALHVDISEAEFDILMQLVQRSARSPL